MFFQKKILSEAESKLVEQQLAEENKLLKEQENIQELLFNLVRMTQIKIDEKEQKSKDFLKAQVRNSTVTINLIIFNIILVITFN